MTFITGFLFVACIFLLIRNRRWEDKVALAESEVIQARDHAVKTAEKIADQAGFDTSEILEILREQATSVTVESDRWSFNMPYGKWAEFYDKPTAGKTLLRGFWPAMKGRLIGVKMYPDAEYQMHHHPWKETLIGVSGTVWVSIEMPNDKTIVKRLAADDVIEIPANYRHAVAKAETLAEFICIWGIPLND